MAVSVDMRRGVSIVVTMMTLAIGCSNNDPFDADARLRPDLMVITPSRAAPGDAVELTYPDDTQRGIAFVLERADDGGWTWTHCLTAGTEQYPEIPPASTGRGCELDWPDVGVSGSGPDVIELPEDVEAGEHRICTANARPNICAELTIVDERS